MPQKILPKQALLAKANEKRLVERFKARWIKYFEQLEWNLSRFHSSEMMEVVEDRKVWRRNLELLHPRNPHGKLDNEERERNGHVKKCNHYIFNETVNHPLLSELSIT